MSTLTRTTTPALQHERPRAGPWATAARIALGGFFVAMVGVNVVSTLPNAEEACSDMAENLAWPGVDTLMTDLVVPNALPFVVAVILFETAVGLMVLSRGQAVRWGLWAASAFMVGLFPVVSDYALVNLPLVALRCRC